MKLIKNERGMLLLDFIFSLVLVMGVTGLLLVFTYTLSVVEVAQYIAFSTSRAYFAGHVTQQRQVEAAKAKFTELKAKRGIRNVFRKEWFDLVFEGDGLGVDEFHSIYSANKQDEPAFTGARLKFVAKVLNIQIPFYGPTADTDTFQAFLTSFIGREPSSQECYETFFLQKWNKIQQLDARYGRAQVTSVPFVEDNGC